MLSLVCSRQVVMHLVSTPLVLDVLWWTHLVWVVLVGVTVVLVVHLGLMLAVVPGVDV